jgi:hypothetical protein
LEIDELTLRGEIAAWRDHRNKHHAEANQQYTIEDARLKLKRLLPLTLNNAGD